MKLSGALYELLTGTIVFTMMGVDYSVEFASRKREDEISGKCYNCVGSDV
jgi:hypothetical protein